MKDLRLNCINCNEEFKDGEIIMYLPCEKQILSAQILG